MSGARTIGFVGLGNMGSALARNLVDAGLTVVTHDAAGPEHSPDGATYAATLEALAAAADVVVLSLPDGSISEAVVRGLLAAPGRRVAHVVDTSTIGPQAANRIDGLCAEVGVAYVDAPVSGGRAGALARTLSVMYSAGDDACAVVADVIAGLSDNTFRVGDRPGPAQALKLANNFLSATALLATSEAVVFGVAAGLDPAVMIDVLSRSSGTNTATTDKFPNHILTGKFASGFKNSLMAKDVGLYLAEVGAVDGPDAVGALVAGLWKRFAEVEPQVDFTRVFPFVEGGGEAS